MIGLDLRIKLLEGGVCPKKRADSVGYDLFANAAGTIDPLAQGLIPLGFESSFRAGVIGMLMDKSGVGKRGLKRVGGVIDWTYRDEWKFLCYNYTHVPFHFVRGMCVVQVVFMDCYMDDPIVVDTLVASDRGALGFGSTDFHERLAKFGFVCPADRVDQACVDWLVDMESGGPQGIVKPPQIQRARIIGADIEEALVLGVKAEAK